MKTLIPADPTSQAVPASPQSEREDQSLHDEILIRLRDQARRVERAIGERTIGERAIGERAIVGTFR